MQLSEETSACIEWLLIAMNDGVLHPIVAAGVFSYYFITTPTTEQCRNELMLLLSILLLRRCGVDWVQYCTPCRAMMKHRGAYYRLTTGHGSVNQWIAYWLDMLCEAGRMLVDEVHSNVPIVVASRISNINMRQRRILDIIEQNQPVKLAQIVMHLHKESINTVKKDLRHLRELGYIGTEGVLKGTVYYKI
jgi:Fic family protein